LDSLNPGVSGGNAIVAILL